MKQFGRVLAVFIVLFLLSAANIFAAAQLSVSGIPLTIDQSAEFTASVSFSCSSCGDSFIRGVFYSSGSSYFGFTQDNNGSWSNAPGGNCTTYFKIGQSDLDLQGSWSGQLKFKLDTGSSYYSGPGEYLFKIGRYTPSCSSPSVWSTEQTIAITGPAHTPAPTSVQNPTSTKTPTPTIIPTASVSSFLLKDSPTDAIIEGTDDAVLAVSTTENPTISSGPVKNETKILGIEQSIFSKSLISLGFIVILACGILGFRQYRKNKSLKIKI